MFNASTENLEFLVVVGMGALTIFEIVQNIAPVFAAPMQIIVAHLAG
jgi:hypothetical protein